LEIFVFAENSVLETAFLANCPAPRGVIHSLKRCGIRIRHAAEVGLTANFLYHQRVAFVNLHSQYQRTVTLLSTHQHVLSWPKRQLRAHFWLRRA
jgi:hypothetical protein